MKHLKTYNEINEAIINTDYIKLINNNAPYWDPHAKTQLFHSTDKNFGSYILLESFKRDLRIFSSESWYLFHTINDNADFSNRERSLHMTTNINTSTIFGKNTYVVIPLSKSKLSVANGIDVNISPASFLFSLLTDDQKKQLRYYRLTNIYKLFDPNGYYANQSRIENLTIKKYKSLKSIKDKYKNIMLSVFENYKNKYEWTRLYDMFIDFMDLYKNEFMVMNPVKFYGADIGPHWDETDVNDLSSGVEAWTQYPSMLLKLSIYKKLLRN